MTYDPDRTVLIDGMAFVEDDDSQERPDVDGDDTGWWSGWTDDVMLPDALSSGHINAAEFRAGA